MTTVRLSHKVKRGLASSGVLVSTVVLAAPTMAQEAVPAVIPSVSSVLTQWKEQAAQFGVVLPEVDPALVEQADASIEDANRAIAEVNTNIEKAQQLVDPASWGELAQQATLPEYAQTVEEVRAAARGDRANYHWRSDELSKFMAASSGPVLQRVPGSWFNAPDVPEESILAEQQGFSLYGPGTPIVVGNQICTVTAAGVDADGRKVAITAGHCGAVGSAVESADSPSIGPSGTVVAVGKNADYSVIELGSNAQVTRSYNGVEVTELGGKTLTPGEFACKAGIGTGTTCGTTWNTASTIATTQICAGRGDSGAPVMVGGRAVGLVDGGAWPTPWLACQTPLQGPLHMPTVTTNMDSVLSEINASNGVGRHLALPQ